jgi:hypothetical protein
MMVKCRGERRAGGGELAVKGGYNEKKSLGDWILNGKARIEVCHES